MRKRKRVGEEVVQHDHITNTDWIQVGFNARSLLEMPDSIRDDYHRHANQIVDEMMGDAIQDLIARYWIPVPPIQAREVERRPSYFDRTLTIERRIRVVKPEDLGGVLTPVLGVRFPVDWLGETRDDQEHPWHTYEPEYDDADQSRGRPDDQHADASPIEDARADAAPRLPA